MMKFTTLIKASFLLETERRLKVREIYRGDTFDFDVSAELETGEQYTFTNGERLRAGLKNDTFESSKYLLYQNKEIHDNTKEVHFEFTSDETKELTTGRKVFEVELTTATGKVMTIYQEDIEIKGDVLND